MHSDATEREHHSPLSTLLAAVTRAVSRFPVLTLLMVLLLSTGAVTYTIKHLKFKTERADLIDPHADYQQNWLAYTKRFGDAADMVVVVEADTPEHFREAIDDLGARVDREPEHFANILYKVDTSALREKGIQYLSPAQLEELIGRLESFGPLLRGKWQLFNLKSIVRMLRFQVAQAAQAPDPRMAEPLLGMALSITNSLDGFARDGTQYNSPWANLVSFDGGQAGDTEQIRYIVNEHGTFGFLFAQPAEGTTGGFDGATRVVERLRGLMAKTRAAVPGVTLKLTGIPVLESDEMRASQQAMFWSSIISYLGVGILLVIGFQGWKHPLLAMIMLAVAMAWAFAFTTGVVGHLNILSVSFVTILVGLGIDYAILFVTRYLELRHHGASLHDGILKTALHVGPGIITGSVTTALAFFCALLTDFLGVAELGIIAGGGILLCALAAFILMPALIAVADRNVEPRKLPTPLQGRSLREALRRSPGGLAVMAILVIAVAGLSAPRVKYDYNLLNLQADGLESVEVQKRILKESDSGLLFAVSLANSPEEALKLKKKFEALPGVHHVQELASKLPRHPSEDTKLLVQGVQAMLSHLPETPPSPGNLDPSGIGKGLEELDQTLGSIDHPLARQVSQTIDRFLDRLHELSLEQQQAMLIGYQQRLTGDLLARMQGLAAAANAEPIELADLPPGLASRLVSADGKQWLLQIFPNKNIWEIEPLTEFIKQVRTVDQKVTGIPIQNFEASRQIRQSYETVALYALLVVFLTLLVDVLKLHDVLLALLAPLAQVFVIAAVAQAAGTKIQIPQLVVAYALLSITLVAWIDWRGLRNSILAMLSPLLGTVLMMGILGLIHVDLNPANLIVLPLIIGIGVDSGVHVLHDYRAQKGTYSPSPSTINAIVLTSLTTMVGFGSMMIAAHRGLWSLGVVLTVGVGSCLFVALVLVPALLTLCNRLGQSLERKRPKDEPPQSDAKDSQQPAKARELSVYYPESAESAA